MTDRDETYDKVVQLIAPYRPDQNGRSMNSVKEYPDAGEPYVRCFVTSSQR